MIKKVFLVLVLVLLVGCDLSTSEEIIEETASGCPYSCHSGSDSLGVEILNPDPNLPENYREIYEFTEFAPELFITNEGEADVTVGSACISGLNQEVFGFSGCECQDFSVVVNEPDASDYKETRVYFSSYSPALVDENVLDQTLNFYTKYEYTTYGVFEACIKGDVKEEGCDAYGNVLDVSSEGPVTVTEVYQVLRPAGSNAVDLELNVAVKVDEDRSSWLIAKEDASSYDCSIVTEYDPVIKVNAYMEELQGSVSCPEITIEDGEGQTTCIISGVPLSDSEGNTISNRESRGYLELEYGYGRMDSVEFRVMPIG
tara:strand:+ start:3029 stop:3973 length:945 start_codon:yes stop_codon:yes gene_type:complete